MRLISFLIFLIFVSGCTDPASREGQPEHTPFCKIIFLDNYYTEFLSTVKSDTSDRNKIFFEKITEALLSDHFAESEYYGLVRESLPEEISDTSWIAKSVADLNQNRTQVDSLISSAFLLCNKHLPNDNIIFYVFPFTAERSDLIRKMGGVTGLTAGRKQVLLTVDFGAESWKDMLEYTVAHEFHHAWWTKTNRDGAVNLTLLRYLIFEGMADSFAHLLYPEVKAPWTTALSDKEKTELWNKIKPHLQADDPGLLNEVMFGSEEYPVWGGYSLGYDIVQSAMTKNPEVFKTVPSSSDNEILTMSAYR